MAYRTTYPERGAVLHVNFRSEGSAEMDGPHYALVISTLEYNKATRNVICCPITSGSYGYEWEVPVPAGILPDKKGVGPVDSFVIADAVKQMDFDGRGWSILKLKNPMPLSVTDTIADMIAEIIGVALT